MRRLFSLLILCCGLPAFSLLSPTANAQQHWIPDLDGYVSSLDTQDRFAVDGRPVERSAKTENSCRDAAVELRETKPLLALGDHLLISGKFDRQTGTLRATQVCSAGWAVEKVSGAAVLEKVGGHGLLSADGRLLKITATSVVRVEAPLKSIHDAAVNDWVRYRAVSAPDGTFAVRELSVGPNLVSEGEQRVRQAKLVVFVAPNADAGQQGQVKFAHLARRYKLPADLAVLDRIAKVGMSVVPAYQKALAQDDPTRIDFHFIR